MIEITAFHASWLIPTLWFIFAIICVWIGCKWFFGSVSEIEALPPIFLTVVIIIIWIIFMIIWFYNHWDQIGFSFHIFKIIK